MNTRCSSAPARTAINPVKMCLLARSWMIGCCLGTLLLTLSPGKQARASGVPESLEVRRKTAAAFHDQGDFVHSIPLLKQIVLQFPHDYEANRMLGVDLMDSGEPRQAIGPLEAAAKARPTDSAAELYLAQAARALGDFAAAAQALQEAIKRSSGSAQSLEAWGSYCLERVLAVGPTLRTSAGGAAMLSRVNSRMAPEGSEEREDLLKQSAAGNPAQIGIWAELGLTQLAEGKVAEARQSLQQAREREPKGAETLKLEALMAAVEVDWPAVQRTLTALAARSPFEAQSAVEFWQHLFLPAYSTTGATWECLRNASVACPAALSHSAGGKGLSAKTLYAEERWEQLLALPEPAAAASSEWLWRGVAQARTSHCDRALPSLERGAKADAQLAGFWLDLCYVDQGQVTEARLTEVGDLAGVHRLKGDILLKLAGNATGAQGEYAAALETDPGNADLLERSAEAYRMGGKVEESKAAARAALAIDPRRRLALRDLALFALDEKNYEEALGWLKPLLALAPSDSLTRIAMGMAYGNSGHPEEAVSYLKPLLDAGYPDHDGAFHAQLASSLRKLGRTDEAHAASAEARRLAEASLDKTAPESAHAPQ